MKLSPTAFAASTLLLAFAGGAACAQSSVTVYGVIDLDLARDNNGSAAVTRMDSGVINGSRIGFKGSEDLGGGLNAIFQVENGFLADTGAQADAARLFNRQSFVGLTGNYGTLKLGRQNNPVYTNLTTFDPFAIGMAGDSSRLFSYNGSRTDNLVSYNYSAHGFRSELQYGAGEVAGNAAAGRTEAGFVGYKDLRLDVVATYQNIRNPADTDATRMTLVAANYNFGVLKAYIAQAWEKGVMLGTATRLDQRDALIGVNAPVGTAGTAICSYIVKTDRALANADARQFAIGYRHDLSKRTAVYISWGELRNDGAAKYKVLVGGKTDKLMLTGIRHIF